MSDQEYCAACGDTGETTGASSLTGEVGTENPPGRDRLRYRLGVHATFKEAMRLAAAKTPGLAPHTSRDDSSAAVAFIDATAVMLDILTFYNERFLNEGYARTATERLSLLELARSIGYELKPGVAASTYLAFEVQIAPGMPETVAITPGIQAQSIPPPGELPQIFETTEALEARPEWNRFGAKTTRLQVWQPGRTEITVSGSGLNLPLGSRLLVLYAPLADDDWEVVEIAGVKEDYERKVTTYTLAKPMVGPKVPLSPDGVYPKIFMFTVEARAFGANAPDWRTLPTSAKRAVLGLGDEAEIPDANKNEWPNFVIHLPVDFNSRFGSLHTFVDVSLVENVIAMASAVDELVLSENPGLLAPIYLFEQYRASTLSLDQEYKAILTGSFIYLDDPEGTALLEVQGAETISRSAFALSGKSTIITADADGLEPFRDSVRSLTVLGGSRELTLAEEVDPEALSGTHVRLPTKVLPPGTVAFGQADPRIPFPPLPVGRFVTLEGFDATTNEPIAALLTIKTIAPHATEDAWDVEFEETITNVARATALFRGNLALSTHGQSHVQVLGHGDARKSWVVFKLAAGPLTYVASASNPRGVASTLEVTVDGVKWSEAEFFYGRDANDEIYTVRHTDARETIVRFGDGRTGRRLPTGTNNLKARYRTGIGSGGNLPAGRITNLMTRPLGLQGVAQPLPASGGDDPEARDDARENAPLSIRTLERLVSLADYADFARTYGGISKAHGVWARFGPTQGVLLTVAGVDGASVVTDPILGENFRGSLERFRDPTVPVQIVDHVANTFVIAARLHFDERYNEADVLAEAAKALTERFSFRRMRLGEAVTASAVISLLQAVRGVIGVDLDLLHLSSAPATAASRLPARGGYIDREGTVYPAELLTLDVTALALTGVPTAAPTV